MQLSAYHIESAGEGGTFLGGETPTRSGAWPRVAASRIIHQELEQCKIERDHAEISEEACRHRSRTH